MALVLGKSGSESDLFVGVLRHLDAFRPFLLGHGNASREDFSTLPPASVLEATWEKSAGHLCCQQGALPWLQRLPSRPRPSRSRACSSVQHPRPLRLSPDVSGIPLLWPVNWFVEGGAAGQTDLVWIIPRIFLEGFWLMDLY